MAQEKNTLYCSFCGKSQHEVRKLIAGPTVFICDECVELCMDIIREENKNTLVKSRDGVPSPSEICSVLDSYVIGQDHAQRAASVGLHPPRPPPRPVGVAPSTPPASGPTTPPRRTASSSRNPTSCWPGRRAAARPCW